MSITKRINRALSVDGVVVTLAFIAMCVYFSATSPYFLSSGNIRNTLVESVPAVLLAAGLTFALVTGRIDLSVGSNVGMSAAVSLFVVMSGAPTVVALVAGIVTGLMFGLVNGVFVAGLGVSDFIVTLATLSVGAGLLQVFTAHTQLTGTRNRSFRALADGSLTGIPNGVLITIVLLLVLEAVLAVTPLGRSFYAVGINAESAYLAGVSARRTTFIAFLISGLVAGMGGALLASHLNSVQPGLGAGYELTAIAASVVGGVALAGGRGRVWQAALGAIFLSTLSRGLQLVGVDPLFFSIVTGAVLVAAVAFDRAAQRWLQAALRPSMPTPTPAPAQAQAGNRA